MLHPQGTADLDWDGGKVRNAELSSRSFACNPQGSTCTDSLILGLRHRNPDISCQMKVRSLSNVKRSYRRLLVSRKIEDVQKRLLVLHTLLVDTAI